MAERIRVLDWASTPLGPTSAWPQSLKTAVDTILGMPGPATILWGPQHVEIYNDAYVAIARERHPALLGRPLAIGWADCFAEVFVPLSAALVGSSTQLRGYVGIIDGPAGPEERVFDADWSPLYDESGAIAGSLQTLIETTARHRAETALVESEERHAFLLSLTDQFRKVSDPLAITAITAEMFCKRLGLAAAHFQFFESDEDTYTLGGAYSDARIGAGLQRSGRLSDHGPDWGVQLCAGEAIFPDDHGTWGAADAEASAPFGARSESAVPLIREGRMVAVFSTSHSEPRRWTKSEKRLQREVAERTWAAVERSRAEVALRDSQHDLAADLAGMSLLRDLAERLVTEENVKTIYEEILTAAISITKSDAGTVQIYDPDAKSLVLLAATGFGRAMTDHFHRVGADSHTACGMALKTGERTFLDFDGKTDEASAMHVEAGYLSAQATPLLSRAGDPLGMLNTHWREPGRRPSDRQLHFLDLLARQAADLFEYRAADKSLRKSEERLALAIDVAGIGHWEFDLDTGELMTSAPCRRNFGRPEDAPFGYDDLVASIHPDDRERQQAAVTAAVEARSIFDIEYRLVTPRGEVRWAQIRGRYEAGSMPRLAGVSMDITERKRAEIALRDSEERLRQFGEASQDVLWIRDAEKLQWIYLTPAFETIYGLTCEEALSGDNYRGWLDLIVPEDRQHAIDSIGRVRDGEHVTFDFRIRRPVDGAVRWLRNTDFPIVDENGEVALIGGIGHDATELREAELRLKTLIEGIPQLVWRAMDDGHWTWASTQWTAFTGQSYEASLDWGWLGALHPEDRPAAREAWSHAIEQGGFEVEYRLCHAGEHRYRWFQTRATPVRDQAGDIIEWLGTSTDIHDLRQLQERQRVLVAELQHRTRNLMGVVRATADKTARASADITDFRARFRVRLEALARVQGLLSRLDEHDRVTFDELIRSELSVVEGGEDRVTLQGPAGVRLRSSTVQTLAMALHELATNAVKYGALGDGGGALAITWSIEPSGDDGQLWLHIDWRESGVAMPERGAVPAGAGQGRELIERALPYQLNARTAYVLGTDGVHCTISIPVSASTGDGGT